VERKPHDNDTRQAHETVAVVLQVRAWRLQVLLWQRALPPFAGRWALPGGQLDPGELLEDSIRRHLAAKVDVRELSHLEQLETRADPKAGRVTTAYLGLIRTGLDPEGPDDTEWHPVDDLPHTAFDHGAFALAGRERVRAKLSYTNLGFALAPPSFAVSELRSLYSAALGHQVSATNLKRVLVRRGMLVPTGERRAPGRAGGRPAEVYRFRSSSLEVTDPFAVLRPPDRLAWR
jgi:ADP-ribose pyrophosphatase YjhB (NUDIX family)